MAGTSKQTIGQKDDEDYISLLPDCLIHHIFSFLPTKDVDKTCVLSKRWRLVWTTVSDLNFSVSYYADKFVDRILTLYALDKVKKFHLWMRLRTFNPYKIDSWVRFAIDHQVEELLLKLKRTSNPWADYTLTDRCLDGCRFSSSESTNWSSLKSLSLENVNVSDDVLRKILMGSPLLEYLTMKGCRDLKGIHSTSLRELVIDATDAESPLHISTPSLLSLRVRGCNFDEMIRIVGAPSLLEAELDFSCPPKSDIPLLRMILCKLQNATRILLGSWWAWVMWTPKVEDVQVLLPNCKSLTPHVYIPDFSFPALENMLATTPNLEKLVLIFEPYHPYSDIYNLASYNVEHDSYWHIKKKLKQWARQLKNVEIS